MVPIKRFGGVESADTSGRQVLIAEPEKILPVVRTVPETDVYKRQPSVFMLLLYKSERAVSRKN